MATRTWIGGGDNSASNAADWSPTGTPQPGDYLSVTEGYPITSPFQSYTMNVYGKALAGDTINTFAANLTLNDYSAVPMTVSVNLGSDTFNLANGATLNLTTQEGGLIFAGVATVNIPGNANLNLTSAGHTTVNLGNHGRWTGTFNVNSYHTGGDGREFTINGGEDATFVNNGVSSASFYANVVVPTAVLGHGTFSVYAAARLEFMSSVGAGQTVTVDSVTSYGAGKLVLDHARQFAGEVVLGHVSPVYGAPNPPAPEVDLFGLEGGADSYSFKNDMLSIFAGHKVIDRLRLHDSSPFGFEVEKVTGGVSILAYADATHTNVGSALPVNIA